LISLGLRSGVDPEEIIDQLKSIACPSPVWDRGEMIKSCADGISKALKWYIESVRKNENGDITEESEMASLVMNEHIERTAAFELVEESSSAETGEMGTICPDCGARLFYEEGCQKCHTCGYSKCG